MIDQESAKKILPFTNNEVKNVRVMLPFFNILCLIFITLKLTGHIDWNWFWVISPILFKVVVFSPEIIRRMIEVIKEELDDKESPDKQEIKRED